MLQGGLSRPPFLAFSKLIGFMKPVLIAVVFCHLLLGDQIPPFFVDSVVALGRIDAKPGGQPPEWVTEASGFLYGYLQKDDPDLPRFSLPKIIETLRLI